MKLPTDLIHKMQGDYISLKYKDGVFTFVNVDEETLTIFVQSFLEWAEDKELVDENGLLDVNEMKQW